MPNLQGNAKGCNGQTPQEDRCLLQPGNQLKALGALRQSEPECAVSQHALGCKFQKNLTTVHWLHPVLFKPHYACKSQGTFLKCKV